MRLIPAPIFKPHLLSRIYSGEKWQTRRIVRIPPWERSESEGAPCWKQKWATVWDNGTWHTWDRNGYGGENWTEKTVEEAKEAATGAAAHQGFIRRPYGLVGTRWYMREGLMEHEGAAFYRLDKSPVIIGGALKPWRWQRATLPSIHMPRECARRFVEVTDVRVQRLNDISVDDCRAEGISKEEAGRCDGYDFGDGTRAAFAALWDSVHGDGAWTRNEWVFAYTFKLVES